MDKHRLTPTVVPILLLAILCVAGATRASAEDTYSLTFSQLAIGASSGSSAHYAVDDVLAVGVSETVPQHSATYSLTNPMASGQPANSGVAVCEGSTLQLAWTELDKPTGALGYDVYRSATGLPDSYARVNGECVAPASYDDSSLPVGTYYYIVYLVDAYDRPEQWTGSFSGSVADTAAGARAQWMLYE
ncbi:hypothetical protein JW916_08740 [Candidatus Sumerlaeota bacterium]|nr:hypothetical protein [Candidatus Sumerlaeota bacterium]